MEQPSNLPALVKAKFKAAKDRGDLTYYPTKVSVLDCGDFPFQVRFSSALANKPKANRDSNTKPVDVFENPKKLLITEWPPAHNLVLNKFAINAEHFILATKRFEEQTYLLEVDDIGAAFACIQAYKEQGEELFAFFNSGVASGASQRHRHIQFLPVKSMRNGISEKQRWDVLADQLIADDRPELPFECFAAGLDSSTDTKHIHTLYLELYATALEIVSSLKPEVVTPVSSEPDKVARISYNLAMTQKAIVLCPRLNEGSDISDSDGTSMDSVALNGTLLGGTLLVKSEREFQALSSNDGNKLERIMAAVGVPRSKI